MMEMKYCLIIYSEVKFSAAMVWTKCNVSLSPRFLLTLLCFYLRNTFFFEYFLFQSSIEFERTKNSYVHAFYPSLIIRILNYFQEAKKLFIFKCLHFFKVNKLVGFLKKNQQLL